MGMTWWAVLKTGYHQYWCRRNITSQKTEIFKEFVVVHYSGTRKETKTKRVVFSKSSTVLNINTILFNCKHYLINIPTKIFNSLPTPPKRVCINITVYSTLIFSRNQYTIRFTIYSRDISQYFICILLTKLIYDLCVALSVSASAFLKLSTDVFCCFFPISHAFITDYNQGSLFAIMYTARVHLMSVSYCHLASGYIGGSKLYCF